MMQRNLILSGLMLAGMLTGTHANAEVVRSPAKALALLTEARVAAQKCGWLSATEREELTTFAARAELAAVRREGAAAAKAAVRQGRARGKAGCTAERKELVLAVLQGAREATGHEATEATAPRRMARPARRTAPAASRRHARRAALPARAVHAPEPRPTVRVQQVAWSGATARQPQNDNDVARYRYMTTAYYAALKCRNRPQGELMRMWRQVRDLHYAILRAGKRDALARAKATARAKGNARRCR